MIDYHIHTDHSGDGKTPLRVMVQHAAETGMSEICITSHYDPDSPVASMLNFDLDFDAYVPEVLQCKNDYADRIKVKLGVEVGLQADKPHVIQAAKESVAKYPFDFVIVSTHFLPGNNYHRAYQWLHDNVSKEEVQARYLRHTLQYLDNFEDFDVLGHLTYFSRFSPDEQGVEREMVYEDNAELYDRIFEILIQKGKGIEINTSSKARFGFFMPGFSIIKRFREMGGEIVTVGSDAHVPQNIGTSYDEAIALLREAGFTSVCTFDERKPAFVNI